MPLTLPDYGEERWDLELNASLQYLDAGVTNATDLASTAASDAADALSTVGAAATAAATANSVANSAAVLAANAASSATTAQTTANSAVSAAAAAQATANSKMSQDEADDRYILVFPDGGGGEPGGGGVTSHSALTDLVTNNLGVTLNPHTQYVLWSEIGTQYYNRSEIDTKLSSKLTPLTILYQGDAVLATGVGVERLYIPFTCSIVTVQAWVTTAPTGASLIVDVNKNGSTIYTTQANRPQIAASAVYAEGGTPQVTALVKGDYLTFDIDQIGSTVAGGKLKVQVTVRA